MKTLIQRSTGDNVSPDLIVNPLCVTELVCTEKGKEYLYSEGFDVLNYEIEIPFRQSLVCSDLINVLDISIGETFYSRLSGWSLGVSVQDGKVAVKQVLTVERSIADE